MNVLTDYLTPETTSWGGTKVIAILLFLVVMLVMAYVSFRARSVIGAMFTIVYTATSVYVVHSGRNPGFWEILVLFMSCVAALYFSARGCPTYLWPGIISVLVPVLIIAVISLMSMNEYVSAPATMYSGTVNIVSAEYAGDDAGVAFMKVYTDHGFFYTKQAVPDSGEVAVDMCSIGSASNVFKDQLFCPSILVL